METPCPLYFRPADVLAAFSTSDEAGPVRASRPRPMHWIRARAAILRVAGHRSAAATARMTSFQMSTPVRPANITGYAAADATGGDTRASFGFGRAVGGGPARLLSHYALTGQWLVVPRIAHP